MLARNERDRGELESDCGDTGRGGDDLVGCGENGSSAEPRINDLFHLACGPGFMINLLATAQWEVMLVGMTPIAMLKIQLGNC